ncbi:MAG TPA: T9SS type A sorting domain-containing protein [Melioribacteraceae bacterium]|nr:T9SS type A sorting domain-containing protein [Melioribacteraceae bacterium]
MRYTFLLFFFVFVNSIKSQQYVLFNKANSDLSSNKIISVKQDNCKNYYIVTSSEFENGAKIASGYLHKFNSGVFTKIDSINSLLLEDIVNDVAFDKNNNLLIATSLGLIYGQGDNYQIYNKDNSPLPDNNVFKVTVDSNNTYYIGIPNYGIYVYKNGIWKSFNYQNSFNGIEDFNFIFIDKQNNIWIGTDYYGLYMFDGISWQQKISNFLDGKRCYIMGITEDINQLKYVTVQTQEGKHYIAKENNANFILTELFHSDHTFTFFAYNSIKADKQNNIYVGTSNGLFMYNQIQWSVFDSTNFNIPGNYFVNGFVDSNNNKIFGIENFGTHKAFGLLFYNEDGVQISTITETSQNITDYYLSQNYPNPFNPSTKIKYQIPYETDVLIKLYDLLGKEVKTLVSERKAGGIYTINLDAAGLPSGIYIYRLITQNYSIAKKLMILK